MEFRQAEASDGDAWQQLLEASAAGDFLHDWTWAEVAAFDGQPQRRFVLEDGEQLVAIVAAQVRRLAMGRAFWYVPHGPVLEYAAPQADARLDAVLAGLRSAARAAGAIAVRLEPRLEAGSAGARLFESASLRRVRGHLQVGHTRLVELTDGDEGLLSSFDKDTRYSIRRAAREGVEVGITTNPADSGTIAGLYEMTRITQRRARFANRPRERYEIVWHQLAGAGRAAIFEARHAGQLLASAMLVVEGNRSFYYLAGSRREAPGERKLFASYALQWALMRHAHQRGVTVHDLWGIAPPDAGTDHPWHGVGQFKRGFGGREVEWAGMWDLIVERPVYWLREAAHPLLELARRVARR